MRRILIVSLALSVVSAAAAGAQTTSPQEPAPAHPDQRPTGLPGSIKWTFNFDAGWGTFGFANSLFDNPKEPGVDEQLSDQWFEGYVKPALSAAYTLASSSEVYGKVSVVGERTYGSVPAEFGADISSFGPEDAYIGWRSGKSLSIGDNALDFTVGRSRYRLGHGFLLFDGAAEGGSRGGYWTNARQAFGRRRLRVSSPAATPLRRSISDKDELGDEGESGSRLWGVLRRSRWARVHHARRNLSEDDGGSSRSARARRRASSSAPTPRRCRPFPICPSNSNMRRSGTAMRFKRMPGPCKAGMN